MGKDWGSTSKQYSPMHAVSAQTVDSIVDTQHIVRSGRSVPIAEARCGQPPGRASRFHFVSCVLVLQALVRDQLLLDPVPHESAQQQGSLLVAYSVAANQVSPQIRLGCYLV